MQKINALRTKRIDIYLTIFLGLCIALGTLLPQAKLPEAPGTDKLHHIIAFAVFVFPICFFRPRHWLTISTVALIYAGLIELIQPLVNRYGELADFWADSIGVVIGVVLAVVLRKMFVKK